MNILAIDTSTEILGICIKTSENIVLNLSFKMGFKHSALLVPWIEKLMKQAHMLPSELLARGTTQDIYVFDVSTSYQLYIQKKQNKAAGISQSDPATQPAPPELAERLALFKERTRK